MNILYVSDLDGTLLQDDATLSPFSRQVLKKLLGEGLSFTVASARSIASIRTILAGLSLRLPVIEFNGAFLSDLASGQHLIVNDITPAVAQDLHQLILSSGNVPFLSTFDGARDRLYYSDILNEGMQWYVEDCRVRGDRRLCHIADLALAFRDRVVCLTTIGREQQLAEMEQTVLERHADAVETHVFENRYSPGWHWLTVHDRRATKDQAIRIVINEWGLEGSELVVFGDNINDLKMFRLADRAIAVENAIEQVKAAATEVIGSNSEDSVVRFIRDDWETQTDDDP